MRCNPIPKILLLSANPQRLLLYALADWSVIAATWLLAWKTPWWLYPLWIVLLASRFHALGVILHDAVHISARRKTASLRAVEFLAGYPIGSTLEAMRYHHLRHHRNLGQSSDPYLKPWVGRSVVRHWLLAFRYFLLTPLWVVRGPYGALAFHLPPLRTSYGRLFLQDRSGAGLEDHAEVIACAREEHCQVLFFLCIGALAAVWPRLLLEFYLAPLVLAGYLAGHRLLHEHVQEEIRDRSPEASEASTRNHHLGLLGQLLLTPHNSGYHRTHHLHPQAAFENLSKLDQWRRQQNPGSIR
jgi:fatty acid desaturase